MSRCAMRHAALQDLKANRWRRFGDGDGDRHLLTLPVCYMFSERQRWLSITRRPPDHRLSAKTLDDDAAARVVGQLQAETGR